MSSLEDDLRALGRSAAVPPAGEDLAAAVLERVAQPPVRRTFGEAVRRRWRSLLALLAVVLAGALVTPPVRAAVAEWLDIGGVEAVQVPSGPTSAPAPPTASGELSLAEASRAAGFTPVAPAALGEPTGVQASAGFVAMSWESASGVIRLEQFEAEPSPTYFKKYYADLEYVPSVDAFWFSTPHQLVLVKKTGAQQTVRVAGPTLVWVRNGVTFRLEGVPEKDRAVELAR
ncbi:hypothetical protein [Kribbella sp. CA-293567]|uniref:hypothetical protein n=1 Tax=Kribbella sp. CA-293567 TaxID=3002436 RepID=UPI0022DD943B|nr:hypothetical protein [Kribbella sp. CA-293567]WBQ02286.1 hypothetical protein OX958_20085 [Kribbella sp. CA-293567]